jgi:hypothetical protein
VATDRNNAIDFRAPHASRPFTYFIKRPELLLGSLHMAGIQLIFTQNMINQPIIQKAI